jgi:Flp pilus assembly protein TadB
MRHAEKLRVARYFASGLIVALIVWLYFDFLRVNDTTVALTLLLVVLLLRRDGDLPMQSSHPLSPRLR